MGVEQKFLQPVFSAVGNPVEVEDLEYGQVYTDEGVDSQTLSSGSYTKVNQFVTNGLSSSDVVPDQANNKITINRTGIYLVLLAASFSGSASVEWDVHVFLDGVNQASAGFTRKLGAGGDVGAGSATGLADVTSTGLDLDVRVQPDGASKDIAFNMISLTVLRIGAT